LPRWPQVDGYLARPRLDRAKESDVHPSQYSIRGFKTAARFRLGRVPRLVAMPYASSWTDNC
jgi:hypothetical protein